MQGIYMDNAATSYPKAPGTGDAMARCMDTVGGSAGRGGYSGAQRAEELAFELRSELCALFNAGEPETCILTPGATFGINMVLKGYLRPGDRVVVSSMEHNAVMRPLAELRSMGVEAEAVPCGGDGSLEVSRLAAALKTPARLVLLCHGSNVCGTVLPAAEIGELCADKGVPFALDAAQTAGHMALDFKAFSLSALIVPGHKGLLGPAGIGAALLSPEFAAELSPLTTGGTGSRSDSFLQPAELPDKFEAGTGNTPGVCGLLEAVKFLRRRGVEAVRAHEKALTERFLAGLGAIDGVRCPGAENADMRMPVFPVVFERVDNGAAADMLEREFGIMTRCGLQCAPAAHRTLGTFPQGAVRFSPGWSTTEREVDDALEAIKQTARR